MQINANLTDPFTIAITVAPLVLLVAQGWLVWHNKTLSTGRKTVRAALNGLLWLVLLAYVLQISWPTNRPATHALLIGNDVPATFARTVRDSLRIPERFTAPTLKDTYDSVTLVGQDFPVETLTRLSQSAVRWVPYDQPDRVQELRWKSVVRQGEMQRVTGRIRSTTRQLLRIQHGNQTLDSLMLKQGENRIALQFPVFGRGRIQTELLLGKQSLDTVRFYSRPTTPLLVRLVLNNPDFESKTLADWLGKQGHSVQLSTTLARNIRSSTTLNNPPADAGRKPDLVITDPANIASAIVRNAVANGRAALFINLNNPVADITVINRALKTRWQVRRVANQETVPAGSNLTAHPYRFTNALNQFAVLGYPVAVQQTAGRVGVSLLNETFPLSLSGDSMAYGRIWYAVMARLQPAQKDNVLVDAPVFSGLPNQVYVNNSAGNTTPVRVGTDTVRLIPSPFNRQLATGTLLTKQTGWQPMQDSLAVYVENTSGGNPAAGRRVVGRFMLAHSTHRSTKAASARRTQETVPAWAWLTLFLVCLTALWVEPKVS